MLLRQTTLQRLRRSGYLAADKRTEGICDHLRNWNTLHAPIRLGK